MPGLDTKTLMNCNPLLILKGFSTEGEAQQNLNSDDLNECKCWLDLSQSMFTSMFPSQDIHLINPNNIKRCIFIKALIRNKINLNKNESKRYEILFELRHFNISIKNANQ